MHPAADRWLRRGALVLTLTLAASLSATAVVVMWPRVARAVGATPPPPEPAYRAGERTDTPADWLGSTGVTVILFAQSSCGACQNAKSFFKALFEDLAGRATVVLATHGPDPDAEHQYGRELNLTPRQIKTTPAGLRVKATPTVIVVNRRGEILHAWEGVGPAAEQTTIRERVLSTVN